ncbi:MAG: recombinase family protein [Rhodobacteraceae bacterium]|nr:recombinase family protein [Paracoccaceae bacterium]
MLVGYARVSTLDQNPSLQIDALREAGCEKIYVEKASGARQNRPQLKAAFEYLRDGDTLVVWKLSRLARSLKQVIQTVQDMQARNLEFKVLTQNIDTSTPEGRLFFHMTAAFDQFQRELIVENTKAGLAAARSSGRKGGRPRSMDDEKVRLAEAMLRDTKNYPFVNDVIKQLEIGRTAFYRYFPPEKIRELRPPHAEMSVSRV